MAVIAHDMKCLNCGQQLHPLQDCPLPPAICGTCGLTSHRTEFHDLARDQAFNDWLAMGGNGENLLQGSAGGSRSQDGSLIESQAAKDLAIAKSPYGVEGSDFISLEEYANHDQAHGRRSAAGTGFALNDHHGHNRGYHECPSVTPGVQMPDRRVRPTLQLGQSYPVVTRSLGAISLRTHGFGETVLQPNRLYMYATLDEQAPVDGSASQDCAGHQAQATAQPRFGPQTAAGPEPRRVEAAVQPLHAGHQSDGIMRGGCVHPDRIALRDDSGAESMPAMPRSMREAHGAPQFMRWADQPVIGRVETVPPSPVATYFVDLTGSDDLKERNVTGQNRAAAQVQQEDSVERLIKACQAAPRKSEKASASDKSRFASGVRGWPREKIVRVLSQCPKYFQKEKWLTLTKGARALVKQTMEEGDLDHEGFKMSHMLAQEVEAYMTQSAHAKAEQSLANEGSGLPKKKKKGSSTMNGSGSGSAATALKERLAQKVARDKAKQAERNRYSMSKPVNEHKVNKNRKARELRLFGGPERTGSNTLELPKPRFKRESVEPRVEPRMELEEEEVSAPAPGKSCVVC